MNIYELDEDARLDYGVDWSRWLRGPDGLDDDTIASSAWTADPGITMDGPTFDDYTTTMFLSEGTRGVTYKATNTITTAHGRITQWDIAVSVVEHVN
jgi:hypothetical protein